MIELFLIGIGTGNPEHVTRQAMRAIEEADLILLPLKGEEKAELADLRRGICATYATRRDARIVEFDLPRRDAANPDYLGGVDDWHDAIAEVWQAEIARHLGGTGKVALLVWGDPALYDSTLRIAGRVGRRMPLTVRVVPGITSIQALCAAHAIPLNDLGAPFVVTTGRQLRDHGWPAGADTVVIMLDGACAFQTLPPEGIHIWWAAYAGMAGEIALSGPLAEAGQRILAARAEARAQHGWVMDIYLMRRGQA